MKAERDASRTAAHVSFLLWVFFSTVLLAGCATARYERSAVLAGVELTETLFLSGEQFRLEQESSEGTLVFLGSLVVADNEWRFLVQSLRAADGTLRQFTPALLYVYRGRSFDNGIALYALLTPRHAATEPAFIRAPCDFDMVR